MTSHHHATVHGYAAHGQLKPRPLQGPSDIADTLSYRSDFAEGLEMDCKIEGHHLMTTRTRRPLPQSIAAELRREARQLQDSDKTEDRDRLRVIMTRLDELT